MAIRNGRAWYVSSGVLDVPPNEELYQDFRLCCNINQLGSSTFFLVHECFSLVLTSLGSFMSQALVLL